MATTVITTYPAKGLSLATWASLLTTENGNSISCARWADKTVQVSGTAGVGGTVEIEGSNDGTNWGDLHDPQGNALTALTATVELIAENPMFIRAIVAGGDGTTNFKVTILGRDI